MVATYSRVFRWNPVLALHCSDPFLPSSLGNSWKPIKTKSMSFPKAFFTAISATAHYHLCSTCQPGGVTHTCARGMNWLNVLTESMYTQNRCSQRGTARVGSSRGNQPGGCDTNTRINQVEWYRSSTLYTVKNLVLNNTPQFAAQFMGCYCNTGQVKGVKKRC